MECVSKMMVYKNRKTLIDFRDGTPCITFKDSWDGDEIILKVDEQELEEVENCEYSIEIETFSLDYLEGRMYKHFFKTEADAKIALSKYKVGDEFFDDEVIKKLLGPFKENM